MPSADALFDAAFQRIPDPELSQPPSNYLRAAGQIASQAGQSILDAVRLPGQVAGGEFAVKPQTPGMWSEEDEYRQQRAGNVIESRAKDLAGYVTGGSYAAPAQKNATGMGIRAYHGSPHDFDRFDLSKIGTGEGAQAYGHGLYFAENPKVAREYEGMLAKNGYDPAVIARDALIAGDRDSAVKSLTDLARANEHIDKIYAGSVQKALELVQSGNPLPLPAKGRMYEVDINANPEQFLDWDKPLSAQAESIQKMFAPVIDPQRQKHPNLDPKGDTLYRWAEGGRLASSGDDLMANVGGGSAANRFKEAGIPGIKYLDQGSRGAGDGSRNYVVFDDKLVDILRKYGIAGAAATGAATMGGNQADAKPTDDFGAKMEAELQSILAP